MQFEHRGSQAVKRNEVAWRKMETISHTIFVDNLRQSMSKSWLWQLFSHEGKVVDVFMCWKRRKSNPSPFAFVRFAQLADAEQAVRSLHSITIREKTITMKMVEHMRKVSGDFQQAKKEFGKSFNHKKAEGSSA